MWVVMFLQETTRGYLYAYADEVFDSLNEAIASANRLDNSYARSSEAYRQEIPEGQNKEVGLVRHFVVSKKEFDDYWQSRTEREDW